MYKFSFLIILFNFLILQESIAKTIEESISQGLLKSDKIKIAKKEYIISKQAIDKALKETEFIGTIDISNSFDKSKEVSYVDGVHYSPSANEILAGRIYSVIKGKFYGK